MNELKIHVKYGEWLQKGFELYKGNALTLIVATLLTLIIGGATGGLLSGPLLAGILLITLGLIDKKEPKPDIGMLFKGFDYFLNTFLFCLVWGILALVAVFLLSMLFCVGPWISALVILALKTFLMFALFLIVDRKMEFWPASLASINRVKANFWPLFGFVAIAALIGMIGLLACGIGVIVTLPITICCLTVAYREVCGPEPAAA